MTPRWRGGLDVLVGRVAIHMNANGVEQWAERSHEIQQIKIQNPYIHKLIYKIFVYKIQNF